MNGFARWGWLLVAMNVVSVIANLLCLAFWNGGPANWAALVICTASGVYSFRVWRESVEDERRLAR